MDVAKAIGPNCKMPIIGIRPGEKLHEEMITFADGFNTFAYENYFLILPSEDKIIDKYQQVGMNIKRVKYGFSYNSLDNPNFLSVDQLRDLIRENVSPSFKPL